MKSLVARGGTRNARAFEKKGPTGAAGFAAKMAAKLKERRAAVAKREAVDKRKAEKRKRDNAEQRVRVRAGGG